MNNILRKNKIYFTISIISSLFMAVATVLLSFALGYFYEISSDGFNLSKSLYLSFGIIFILILGYKSSLFSKEVFIEKAVESLKNKLFKSFMKMDSFSFNEYSDGEKISILTNEVNTLRNDYFENLTLLTGEIFSAFLTIAALFLVNLKVAVFLIFTALLTFIVPKFFNKKLEKYQINLSNMQKEFSQSSKEYIDGYELAKSFKIENVFKDKFEIKNKNLYISIMKSKKWLYLMYMVEIFLSGITFLLGMAFGIYLVLKNQITVGAVLTAVQLQNNLVSPMSNISEYIAIINSTKALRNKHDKIMNYKEVENGIEKNNFEKSVKFNNVSFSYTDERYMENLNIEFLKNKKYAIIGLSGSGKSTILNLLSKRIKVLSGEILIDDMNINEISDKSYFSILSKIDQEVFIFKGTIRENITLYKNYDEDKIISAMKKSGLESYIDIKDSYQIEEKGKNLSGGEMQRISIARALIRDSEIIVADEIFSALDNENTDKIEKTLLSLDKTLISVTHRIIIENLKNYDSIIVMNNGKVIFNGDFEELKLNKKIYNTFIGSN
ncbi:MAG: ABC transporter ATP-binding protein [Peptoniphilaceae bacterium]|nr:ABC transporter ATP-binding protein/permease [Peptoniphilaceae bacterium]MDD7383302.1 ABC transporter ATP-binding protein [Peptoniphilaceae bacterium]MDY3738327.1 ABC transporter ATP-binding protein [Peptoniphilaceae bacterium]